MNVLIVGGGGREHAIAWALSKSEQVEQLYCCLFIHISEPTRLGMISYAVFCLKKKKKKKTKKKKKKNSSTTRENQRIV